jgi:hypothetical protein
MRVYGGYHHVNGRQVRCVVAGSVAQVAKAIHTTVYTINKYWSVTGNPVEINVAMLKPGTPFVCDKNKYNARAKDYQALDEI